MSINEQVTAESTAEKIEQNFARFRSLCERLGNRKPAVLAMLDELGERIALCPASSAIYLHNCFPGGLVEHSMRVLQNALKLTKAFGYDKPPHSLSEESLIMASLFHDFGKIGSVSEDRYLPQDSSWHREQGRLYTVNKSLVIDPTGQGALFLLQHYGVTLTEAEYVAILTNDGQYAAENKPYSMREPTLAIVIQQADLLATREEKLLDRRSL